MPLAAVKCSANNLNNIFYYKNMCYQEDATGDHVTIQLEDTQQVLNVNKKFIEKVQ